MRKTGDSRPRKLALANASTVVILLWLLLELAFTEWSILSGETCTFDWDAYMEQVSKLRRRDAETGVSSLNFDYSTLSGDTGPLVYPAVHTWIHAGLSAVTGWDPVRWTTEYTPKDIPGYEQRTERPHGLLLAIQQGYMLLHLATLIAAAGTLYRSGLLRTDVVGWRAALTTAVTCLLLSLSRRVRNTATTGLFNDTWAMLLAHAAVLAFTYRRWVVGCVLYSLGVGVKMNVLLFAPGLLYLLLAEGGAVFAAKRIAVCAAVQLAAAAPFLAVAPRAYLQRAFDLGRQFDQQWSVNLRWLPAGVFGSKAFALALLGVQAALLLLFVRYVWRPLHTPLAAGGGHAAAGAGVSWVEGGAESEAEAAEDEEEDGPLRSGSGAGYGQVGLRGRQRKQNGAEGVLDRDGAAAGAQAVRGEPERPALQWLLHGARYKPQAGDIALVLYSANLLGIACARSLHFQFFCWYFHSLPLLLRHTRLPLVAHVAYVGLLELCWGNHPPQAWSSVCITCLHLLLVAGLWHGRRPGQSPPGQMQSPGTEGASTAPGGTLADAGTAGRGGRPSRLWLLNVLGSLLESGQPIIRPSFAPAARKAPVAQRAAGAHGWQD